MPTLPILASFWRTFRSGCPPFPNLPAFGGHSGLHAYPSHTRQLLEDIQVCMPNLPKLASFWRTFRSACPHFPYLPALGEHSGLHAHPSHTCQLLEDIQVCMPTLPILASFWRTFRSACPPFPNLPAFGGHSGLHAHPSQQLVFSLVRMWAGCLLIVQNVSSLSSHWPECWQLVSSLVRMRAACLLIGLNGIVCRYHLGTLAFGSLIIAIIRMIRVMLEGRMYKFKLLLASIS